MAKLTMTDEEVAKLREANGGDLAVIETPLGTAAFRCPTRDEYVRAVAMVSSEASALDAPRWMACECVVSPESAEFARWVGARPGIPKAADGPIMRLAGVDMDAKGVDAENEDGTATTTVTTAMGDATFKVPDERQWKEHQRLSATKGKGLASIEFLALACVVSPDRATFQSWLDSKPGIAATVCSHIRRIAGMEEEERAK